MVTSDSSLIICQVHTCRGSDSVLSGYTNTHESHKDVNICAVVSYIVESMLLSRILVLLMSIHSSLVAFTCTLIGWYFRLKYAAPDSLHHWVSVPTDRNNILRTDTQTT
ncbi:hypothetical protein BDV38DRAFT_198918 [Aspergillus pseudotamarii]|uniref:Uncharacterized protein n=1 Tax=Aspergillus pseudotamarii TaxID=132259 RepID=A0A5N6SE73_ASPPS|nr:uncharacterized protein BDV38DRAFT_198918 [Aspergillus pseudotamarii]KAE8132962.1 hypothetical protein BDV38DRAFT_198918 [Aspergillus pseudotamarii]